MFSVVIPLYNKELSIGNTIKSVLDQSFQDFEIVVVNDGSTDGSALIVEGLKDERIRIIHQDNKGVSAARNHGIAEARNEWVAFLDGDDLWCINHLSEMHKMIMKFPQERVFVTSFEYSDGRNKFSHTREAPITKIENYFKEVLHENIMWTSVVVVHKSCIEKVGGFNEILNRGEDLDLWGRIANEYSIVKNTAVTAIYRIEAENRTSLSKKLECTHIYHLDFASFQNEYERIYYQYLILKRLYAYGRVKDIPSFSKLKRRYPEITWTHLFLFILTRINSRINRALKKPIRLFKRRASVSRNN